MGVGFLEAVLVKEFILDGLDCANCASKIEAKVNDIDGIKQAQMNFANKTLTVEIENDEKLDEILAETKKIVNRIEPGIDIREKSISKSSKKVLLLMGLSCANCAAKMEKEIKNLNGVKSASINFAAKKLYIEVNNKHDFQDILDETKKIIKKIEPDVNVVVDFEEKKEIIKKEELKNINKFESIKLVIGTVLFAAAVIFKFSTITEFIVCFISYILVGGDVLLRAARNITRGQIFDENFLMSAATVGAFSTGQFPEGAAVMLFYKIGEMFQDAAVNRSRKSIADLMDIRPDYANLITSNGEKKVDPDDVEIGDRIIIKPGEKIPLDGKVLDGKSMVNTSALTGESVPFDIKAGCDILAGCINMNGALTVEVTKKFGESTAAKILDMVENAANKKAPTENFITRFARYYTPVVVITALLLAVVPPLVIPGAVFSKWIYRALVFLVVSCPCALVISIPLGFFGGIGGASRNGILVKGSNYLEALNNIDTVIFDKTGTLTKGVFKVTEISPKENFTEDELLKYAAYAESYSNHPIAVSILNAYNDNINKNDISNYEEISGCGIKVNVYGKEILAGNIKLMAKENISYDNAEEKGTIVHVAVDKKYAGYIVISDETKDDSKRAINGLKKAGIKKTVMLTGDSSKTAQKIAEELGLDEFYAELLPDEKVNRLEMLDKEKPTKGKLVFVGDGINDAPVLARADIGIAMGGLGSDAAIEAADVVIMTDEPSKIVNAIKIAKRTIRIVWENIIFALAVKAVVLILGALGMATMWEAVFADVGVTIIAVLNSMRAMKAEK